MTKKLLFVVAMALAFWSKAEASTFPFTVYFGSDGVGTFVYSDGLSPGFTTFDLDFSKVNANLSDLNLNTPMKWPRDGGIGASNDRFGPGGSEASYLYNLFTNPSYTGAEYLSFEPGFVLVLAGQSSDSTSHTSVNIEGLCATPGASTSQYSYCTPTQTGSGIYTDPGGSLASVPEPSSFVLMTSGLFGLGLFLYKRKRV